MVSISIIMPLYNAAKYLEESLRSIQKQTFTDYELICINDASTDAVIGILEKFQREDSRIKVLHNDRHCGAAFSRNRGMREAKGKYLVFLDGDDIFEEEMLSCMYHAAENYQLDVLVTKLKHVPSEEIYHKQWQPCSDAFYRRYSSAAFEIKDYMSYEFGNWDLSLGGKLFRKDFIVSNVIEFQDLSCANDVYFVCMSMLLAKRFLYLRDDRVMLYQRDHCEPTRISYDRDPKCTYLAFEYIMEELKRREKFDEVCEHYYYRLQCALRTALFSCKKEERAEAFYQFLQEEGIDQLISLGGAYYNKINESVKNLLEQFKVQDFDSKWYYMGPGIELPLAQKRNIESIINLFEEYRMRGGIGVWGVGRNGLSFLKFCRENHLHIDMVVDKNVEKQGRKTEGYFVESPNDIGNKLQLVIVTPRAAYENVVEELSGQDIDIIDINQFLYMY